MTSPAWAPAAPVLVVTGHYGVGKTNLSLNLALDAAARGLEVTVVDLDVVVRAEAAAMVGVGRAVARAGPVTE